MLKPLTDAYPLRSALASCDPCDPRAVSFADMAAELDDELDRRRRLYPGMVARGVMKPADADHHIDLWRAMIDDFHHFRARTLPAAYLYSWDARVRELRRELDIRRAAYPKWIASPTNPLTAADAARKLDRLDALHYRWFMELIGFNDRPAATDPARCAWTAADERRRQADRWAAAIADGTNDEAAAARHQQDCWRVIELYARACDGADIGLANPDAATLAIIATEAQRRADEALDQTLAGRLPQALLGQLNRVARWLSGAPIAPAVRLAA